jgi:hypothetical protein
MIYGYVFDPNTMTITHKQMFCPTKHGHLAPYTRFSQWWPKFLQPLHVDRPLHMELVEHFIKHNTHFQARNTEDLNTIIGRDMFDIGIRLSLVAI